MNVKKRCKLKLANRLKHYQSFGWLRRIVFRCRGDKVIRHYLKTGKYIRTTSEVPHQFSLGSGLWVKDLFITSKVRRSRIKNIPDGCVCLSQEEIQLHKFNLMAEKEDFKTEE